MIIDRRATAAATLAILLGVGVLAGCASTPKTPQGLAASKAQEWRDAAYGGDQSTLDSLYCDGKSNWDTAKVKDWPGDKNSTFDAPEVRSDVDGGVYEVTLRNPEWGSAALIYIKVSEDTACVNSVTSPG